MKFPGENEITLTEEAIRELLKAQAPALFGDESARITKIATKSWPAGLVVTFTTDPEMVAEPAPPPRIRHEAAQVNPRPSPTNIADEDHPF